MNSGTTGAILGGARGGRKGERVSFASSREGGPRPDPLVFRGTPGKDDGCAIFSSLAAGAAEAQPAGSTTTGYGV